MDKRNLFSSINKTTDLMECNSDSWNTYCKMVYTTLSNENDRSIICSHIQELLKPLIMNCNNDQQEIRATSEETISKIVHFCEEHKLLSYLSFVLLNIMKNNDLSPRSCKSSILVLNYTINSIKQQRHKIFAYDVFSIIKEKPDMMIHSLCIESFSKFMKSYLSIFGIFLNRGQVYQIYQILMSKILIETALTRHHLGQCTFYLNKYCTNYRSTLYSDIIQLCLDTFETSSNENEIIGVAELLKYNKNIVKHSQYHDQLLHIIVLCNNALDRQIGVTNVCLELITVLLNEKNHQFRSAILLKRLKECSLIQFLLENVCSRFLYNKTDETYRKDIQISIQSNLLNFVIACSDISISDVRKNILLVKILKEICNHSDFLIREKAIIFISEMIKNDVFNKEENVEYISILAMAFEDPAHSVLATLIAQISKVFNGLLQVEKNQQVLIKNVPFTTYVMKNLTSLIDRSHWLVVCKICEFYSILDFTYVRTHFGYSTARFYQEKCYTQLYNLLSCGDIRIRQNAQQNIMKILKSSKPAHEFDTHFNRYISYRYFCDQNLIYKSKVDNLERKSFLLSKLCNGLTSIQKSERIGNISCLSICTKEMSNLYQLFIEYNLLSTVLTLMTKDYSIATDVTCQIDLFNILTSIIPGFLTEDVKNKNENLISLKTHILKIFEIYVKVCGADIIETNSDSNKSNNMNALKEPSAIYEVLFETIKSTFVGSRMTLKTELYEKVFQLLQIAVKTLISLVNVFPVEDYLTAQDKLQLFTICKKLYKLIPIHALQLLNQLIKSLDVVNYKMLLQELHKVSNEQKLDIFNINSYITQLESKRLNLTDQPKLELDKSLEKVLKQITTKIVMHYSEMTAEEQREVLELFCTLLCKNYDYIILDPEQLLLVKVLKQFDMIEQGLTRIPYFPSNTSIRFILIISLKNISPSISLSKVLNLVDSILTNICILKEASTSAITPICELLITIFCNKNLINSKDQIEINTLKEVLLHTLYKMKSNIEIMQTLILIINKDIEPHIENLQKYMFSIILEKTLPKSAAYWYFTLKALDCMTFFFKTAEIWLKLLIDNFMKQELYEIETLLGGGCCLAVILNFDNNTLINTFQTYGYNMENFAVKITRLLIKLIIKYSDTSNEFIFSLVSCIIERIQKNSIKLEFGKEFDFPHLNSSNVAVIELLNLFCSLTATEHQNLELHGVKLYCTFTEKKHINVFILLFKLQLENEIFMKLSPKNTIIYTKSGMKNNRQNMEFLLHTSKNKYTPIILASYNQNRCDDTFYLHDKLSVPNITEWNLMRLKAMDNINEKRFTHFYGTFFQKLHGVNFHKEYSIKSLFTDSCECYNSNSAGACLLNLKSEKKVEQVLKSNEISFIFYKQWIHLCFQRILSDLRKKQNINNTLIKHIYVPPLLKILMENLLQNFNKVKMYTEGDEKFMATINSLSCFFQKLYELQLEAIGKMDLVIIEKIFTENCLTFFDTSTIVECFLKILEEKTSKIDSWEQRAVFMNSILKVNFIWQKINNFISSNADLSQRILITLSCFKEKSNESIINNTNYIGKEFKSKKEKLENYDDEILHSFLRMSPFYGYVYVEENKIISEKNSQKFGFDPLTLLEYQHLHTFIQRLNLFGFTNKYQYEELFTFLLIVYNMENDEYLQTPAEIFRCKKLILEAICNLIILCYREPCIGKKDELCLHYPRIILISEETICLKKLFAIHCDNKIGKLRSIFSLPNLERSCKERQQFATFECEKNQGNLTKPDIYKRFNLHLIEMKIDVDSSVLLMMDTLLERMLKNYLEVVPSLNKLVEFCVMKDRFEHLFSNINFIRETISVHDTLSNQHIIYCLLKCLSINESIELTQLSNILQLVNTCLKNKQSFVKISTLNGLLVLFESFYSSNKVSKDDITLACNSILPYINKMQGNSTYSETHDRLLCSLIHYIAFKDDNFDIFNRYLEPAFRNITRIEVFYCLFQSFEYLVIQKSIKEKVLHELQQVCLEYTKSDNIEIALVAFETLITAIYAASSAQLELTEDANGIVQTEMQSNNVVLETTNRLFQLLRVSAPDHASLIGHFLYHIIIDLIRPVDMLSFVTKEFLNCYNPYSFIIAKILYGLFRSAIDANMLVFLQDLVLSILQSVLEINNYNDRLFRLTILFGSTSLDTGSINIAEHILNLSKAQLFHQDTLFITSVKEFFRRLNETQKKSFIEVCKPFENSHNEMKFILKEICIINK